jgi:hypothetical protein
VGCEGKGERVRFRFQGVKQERETYDHVSSSSDFEEAEKSSTAVESDSTSRTSNLAVRLERKLLGLVVLVLVRPREGERAGEVAARVCRSRVLIRCMRGSLGRTAGRSRKEKGKRIEERGGREDRGQGKV